MVQRTAYLHKLAQARDTKKVKVITGIRCCGKSTLLAMFRDCLRQGGAREEQMVAIDLDDPDSESLLEYRQLEEHVKARLVPGATTYVFLDGVELVPMFEKCICSLLKRDGVDIYITASNACLLSGEFGTLLSGRYTEIMMLPLSFAEYREMKGGELHEAFASFCQNGAFPHSVHSDDKARREHVRGICNAVLLKDVVAHRKNSEVGLLEKVLRYLLDNVGNVVSVNRMVKTLALAGVGTTPFTAENYSNSLADAFMVYRVSRYDIAGNQELPSMGKYYAVDLGLRNLLLGSKNRDIGKVLENIVFLELLRRGYDVFVGKIGVMDVDFVAMKGEERHYYQVAESVSDKVAFGREFAPLKKIRDIFPKFVLTLDDLPFCEKGINHVNIMEWLLES